MNKSAEQIALESYKNTLKLLQDYEKYLDVTGCYGIWSIEKYITEVEKLVRSGTYDIELAMANEGSKPEEKFAWHNVELLESIKETILKESEVLYEYDVIIESCSAFVVKFQNKTNDGWLPDGELIVVGDTDNIIYNQRLKRVI